jgi:hypothetical protein
MRALLILALAVATGAHANPLNRPDVWPWFYDGQWDRHATERKATSDFAKCLATLKGKRDAVLDCATQVLDANGVPRR